MSDLHKRGDVTSVNHSAFQGHRMHRLLDPVAVFSVITILLLAVIWFFTFNLSAREYLAAEHNAANMVVDFTNTYEAQMVRALREIDNTLKLVRYGLDTKDAQVVLDELRANGLLPPEILFTVNITDINGNIIATTHPSNELMNISLQDFQRVRGEDDVVISSGISESSIDSNLLTFSRRVLSSDQEFKGVVTVSVNANYFVSIYDEAQLGKNGVLGLIGTDGVFLVHRTGESIQSSNAINYKGLIENITADDVSAELKINQWDNKLRYTAVRELYEFPIAIVVAVSQAEQLIPAERITHMYMWRAAAASIFIFIVMVMLGRLSWQLQKERTKTMEERVAHARRVEYLAYHDNLTTLPNRALFSQLFIQGMEYARRYNKQLALLFLDLDHFKTINDTLGHDAGDVLLQELGERLSHSVRESDVVARLGGDEFVILLPEIHEISQVESVAEKILNAVSRPFDLVGQEFRITISIGGAIYPNDGEDEQTLMKNADTAMYYAKERGRNNFQIYSDNLNKDSLESLTLESSMRKALQNNEFRLFYQSKHDMKSGHVTGIEALIRWQHPELGMLSPMQFIPLAEENGLIVSIGRWVFHTAMQQNVSWQKEGMPKLSMAVNLTARQFLDNNLVLDIRDALQKTGMKPELLELEITESMIMNDMKQTIRILHDLKKMGVRIAIDNFGTGYSSLCKLEGLPFDTIKIDGCFINDANSDNDNNGLTRAIIDLGKSLGFTVVAEGVESKEQFDYLRQHACDQYQGFYVNKPMPAQEFITTIYKQL